MGIFHFEEVKDPNPDMKHVCAYCGHELSMVVDLDRNNNAIESDLYQLNCWGCHAQGPMKHSREEAISAYYHHARCMPVLYEESEVIGHNGLLFCWVEKRFEGEHNYGYALPALLEQDERLGIFENKLLEKFEKETLPASTYGVTWRCWTDRPSDECRHYNKWQDLPAELS